MKKKLLVCAVLAALLLAVAMVASADTVWKKVCMKNGDQWYDYTISTTSEAKVPTRVSVSWSEFMGLYNMGGMDLWNHNFWYSGGRAAFSGSPALTNGATAGDYYVSSRVAHECKEWAEKEADLSATCTEKATQGRTVCTACGAEVNEGIRIGEPLGHDFTVKVVSADHKKTDPTCTAGTEYYCKCVRCAEFSEGYTGETWFDTDLLAHTYVEKAEEKYLCTPATCLIKATYYKSCSACGAKDSETFSAGELGAHVYVENPAEEYLVSAATCTEKAVYYKSCSLCEESSAETFEYGEPLGHKMATYVKFASATGTRGYEQEYCTVCGVFTNLRYGKSEETAAYFTAEPLDETELNLNSSVLSDGGSDNTLFIALGAGKGKTIFTAANIEAMIADKIQTVDILVGSTRLSFRVSDMKALELDEQSSFVITLDITDKQAVKFTTVDGNGTETDCEFCCTVL